MPADAQNTGSANRFIRRFVFVLLVFLLYSVSTNAQYATDDTSRYLIADLYGQARDDSLILQPALGITLGIPLTPDGRLVFEIQRPLMTGFDFKGRPGEDRIAATLPVMFAAMLPIGLTAIAFGADDKTLTDVYTYAAAPFGSHLGLRATPWLTVYGGVIPEVILFTDNDGILLQSRVGFRLDRGLGLTLSGGFQQTNYLGFDEPSSTFPIGFFVGVSFANPKDGRGFDH